MRGYVQVYTGEGKGKTTAALGLALRAAGAGLRVFIGQFIKCVQSSELRALERLADRITIRQYGLGRFIEGEATEQDIEAAMNGFNEVSAAVASGDYDVVVLDEVNVAVRLKLIPVEAVLTLMSSKPDGVELVITGRDADPMVIERADLVTEMVEIKHYFRRGVQARLGIEK